MNNIQTDIEFKTCRDCNIEKSTDEFYPTSKYYTSYCKKCMIVRSTKTPIKDKKVKQKKLNEKLLKEVTEFINKVERLRGYIDVVDAYRLVSLRVDCLGVKFYERVSVEDELILSYGELKNWQKDAFQK